VALLDRSYAALVGELTTRDPSDRGGTWYEPDPTVGFWGRRMAQESVIHRIDTWGEQALAADYRRDGGRTEDPLRCH
jgi:hypothetical protein